MKTDNARIRIILKKQIKFVCDTEIKSLKPGNVHRYSEGHGMNLKDFLKSSLIISKCLTKNNLDLGKKILISVNEIQNKIKKNTNLGIILMLSPIATIVQEEGVSSKEELLKKCNLHTIVRLPNGVFSPYTSIKTNLLFFDKGEPTKKIWYYEMPYPEGVKNFNKGRPITIKDFDALKKWWKDRKENEYAWSVPVKQIVDSGFNLDIKNPHIGEKEIVYSSEEILNKLETGISKSKELIKTIKEIINA